MSMEHSQYRLQILQEASPNGERKMLADMPLLSGVHPVDGLGDVQLKVGPEDAKDGQKVIVTNEVLRTIKDRNKGRQKRYSMKKSSGEHIPRRVVKFQQTTDRQILPNEVKQTLRGEARVVFSRVKV